MAIAHDVLAYDYTNWYAVWSAIGTVRASLQSTGGIRCELGGVQALIEAVDADQLLVGALFDDASFIDDDDAVGVLDRGEAVGDDEGGAALGQLGQRCLDRAFSFGRSEERRGGRGCGGWW